MSSTIEPPRCCGKAMRLRTTVPYTADQQVARFFNYYHCVKCKANSARVKPEYRYPFIAKIGEI